MKETLHLRCIGNAASDTKPCGWTGTVVRDTLGEDLDEDTGLPSRSTYCKECGEYVMVFDVTPIAGPGS